MKAMEEMSKSMWCKDSTSEVLKRMDGGSAKDGKQSPRQKYMHEVVRKDEWSG